MLSVDGYIPANCYHTLSVVYNGASGGSGGSIIINTALLQVIFIYYTDSNIKVIIKLISRAQ